MPGALDGVKVVEMGVWVAGPSAAAMLVRLGRRRRQDRAADRRPVPRTVRERAAARRCR